MLLLVQPRLIPADPHGAIVDSLGDSYQDLRNVEVRAAR
jgi:hypothetical protein